MKNNLYFIVKVLLVLKIKSLLRLFGHVGKTAWLERGLISKFMTSKPGLRTIAIHILPSISESKGNQTIKVCQLIEYNKTNYFLRRLCGKWGRETSYRPLFIFWKILILGWRQVACSLVLLYFNSLWLKIKTNCTKL